MKVGQTVEFTLMTSLPGERMRFAKKVGVIRKVDSNGWYSIGCDGLRHLRKAAAMKLLDNAHA